MHVDAQPLAKHPARIADASAIVDRERDRHRMDDVAITRLAHQMTLLKDPLHLRIGDLAPGNADLGLDDARSEEPADRFATTCSIVSPAISSAACTALPTEVPAASTSTIVPLRTPREI